MLDLGWILVVIYVGDERRPIQQGSFCGGHQLSKMKVSMREILERVLRNEHIGSHPSGVFSQLCPCSMALARAFCHRAAKSKGNNVLTFILTH